jgi:hypothetical protein
MSTFQRDRVEDEELGLRTEVGGIADADGLQVGLGALGDASADRGRSPCRRPGSTTSQVRISVGLFEERVDVGGVRVRHQQHVRGFDALPAGDRRAVEGVARVELVFVERATRHRDVLFLAAGIGEAEINELDFVVLDHLHHVVGGRHLF